MKVVIFCGGRGSSEIIKGFLGTDTIDLTLAINGYDDGKSTGRIRDFLGTSLGPSDFRKNISTVLEVGKPSWHSTISEFLEHRIQTRSELDEFLNQLDLQVDVAHFSRITKEAPAAVCAFLHSCLSEFLEFEKSVSSDFDFADCAMGNLVFAGSFLKADQNFNKSLDNVVKALSLPCDILNVTDGQNAYLNGITDDGLIITDEGDLVENRQKKIITDVVFSQKKISPNRLISLDEFHNQYVAVEPLINPRLASALHQAEVIIYGPGTQFSSLIPSYKTKGVPKSLFQSSGIKCLLLNLDEDNDLIGKSGDELLSDIDTHLSFENSGDNINWILVDKEFGNKRFQIKSAPFSLKHKIFKSHCSIDGQNHDRNLVVSSILNIAGTFLSHDITADDKFFSIVMPTLDEGERLDRAIEAIETSKDLNELDIRFEIIISDGANDQKLKEKIAALPAHITHIEGHPNKRGQSIINGIKKAKGNRIAIFPSDMEYSASDLASLIKEFNSNKYGLLIGNRSHNVTKQFEIEARRSFLSIFGGVLASAMLFVSDRLYVADVFSTLKVFSKRYAAPEDMKRLGVDFEVELIRLVSNNRALVAEFPVAYEARTYDEGKKTKMVDGLRLLAYVLFKG